MRQVLVRHEQLPRPSLDPVLINNVWKQEAAASCLFEARAHTLLILNNKAIL